MNRTARMLAILLASAGAAVAFSSGADGLKLESLRHEKVWAYTEDVTVRTYSQTIPWYEPNPATFRWTVAETGEHKGPRPAGLVLHMWGGNRENGWLWWFNGRPDGGGAGGYRGALLFASDHTPAALMDMGKEQYDWWTGVRSTDGAVHPVTQERLLAGLDFLLKAHDADPTRVFVWGLSMGGAGAAQMAVEHPERFAFAIAVVGVYVPHLSPEFRSAYEKVWGWYAEPHPKVAGLDRDVWDYYDLVKRIREDPARDLPLMIFANGRYDKGIGWKQAVEFFRALQDSRQPHVFRWTDTGHDARPLLPARRSVEQRDLGIDVRLGQSLPAFTRCSLDGEPGNGDESNGEPAGQANLYLGWDPDRVVDQPDRWEAPLWLSDAAPKDDCTVDVTPRRCQQFHPRPGETLHWSSARRSGQVVVDAYGLVTIPAVAVTKAGARLTIRRGP